MKTLLKTAINFHVDDLPEGVPQSSVEHYESLTHLHEMVSMHTLMASQFYNRVIYQTYQKYNPVTQNGEMHFSFEDATPFLSIKVESIPFDSSIVTIEQKAKQLASNLDQLIDEILRSKVDNEMSDVDQALTEYEKKGQVLPEYSDLMERVKRNLH